MNPFDLLHAEPASVTPITGSASSRKYWRVELPGEPRPLILTQGDNPAENQAFIYLARKLSEGGVRVPQVLATGADGLCYVQSYAGADALIDHLNRPDLLAEAMRLLARVHAVENIDFSRCFPVAQMDRRAIFWDLNYFKYCYLKTRPDLQIDEPALEDDFELLAEELLQAAPQRFMVRDFQSRNIMVDEADRLTLIDFQGGRRGPVHYDVVSFLWQARAGFTPEQRHSLISVYCQAAGLEDAAFRRALPPFVLFRMMQVLGAYGFRGRYERKEQFLNHIPAAEQAAASVLASSLGSRYPYLHRIFCT